MQIVFLLEQIVNGLVLGGYYLLLALGLSLIFSVGGVVNLAHGAFYAIGAYVALEVNRRYGFAASIVISPAVVGLLGVAFERFLLAVVFVVMASLWLLLHKTSFGRVVRAGVQRPDMVAALGIRLQPYMTTIVVLGVATAALGGVLFGPIAVVHPAMGTEIMTVA